MHGFLSGDYTAKRPEKKKKNMYAYLYMFKKKKYIYIYYDIMYAVLVCVYIVICFDFFVCFPLGC